MGNSADGAEFPISCRSRLRCSHCGFLVELSIIEWMIIFLLIGGMFSLELLNTAIEHTVDLITDKHHPLAKAAKDAAAGAVCVFAVISCIIGLLIFLPKL